LHYIEQTILPKSRDAVHFALRAARIGFVEDFLQRLDAVEQWYLRDHMRSEDAVEGVRAFLERRTPSYRRDGSAP
jgi:enoyl-CoA hydratase/carnithine racemase